MISIRCSRSRLLLLMGLIYMCLMFYIQSYFISYSNLSPSNEEHVFHNHPDSDENEFIVRADKPIIPKPVISEKNNGPSRTLQFDNLTFISSCDNKKYSDSYFIPLTGEAFVYSAYLDDRKPDIFVRFMILRGSQQPHLWCHFQHPKNGRITTVPSQDLKGNKFGYYELCENHGMPYGGYVSSCPFPKDFPKTLCSVHLSISDDPKAASVLLPLRPVSNPTVNKIGMCIPAIFGNLNPSRMIEFIEVSKLLGVQHMHIYHAESSKELKKVLDYYQKVGTVDIVPWKMPPRASQNNWNFGQILNINDCLFRSMSVSEFVAFHDIDEHIVPQKISASATQSPLAELQKALWTENTCGVCFPSVFFPPSMPTSDSVEELRIFKYTKRSSESHRVRTKCFVQARRIFEMGIHHISKPNEEFYNNYKAEPSVAVLHHYRDCLGDYGMSCGRYQKDTTLLKYMEDLRSRWQKVRTLLSV